MAQADYISNLNQYFWLSIMPYIQIRTNKMLLQFLSKNKKATKKEENNFVQGISKASQTSEYIQLVSPTNMSVLIIGESGTGKK
jgi:two-component system response regulator HydG